MQLPFWRNYWQKTWKHRHPSQYYANRQTRTLYFSKQREKNVLSIERRKDVITKKKFWKEKKMNVQDVKQGRKTEKWIDYIDIKGLFEVKYLQKIAKCLWWKESKNQTITKWKGTERIWAKLVQPLFLGGNLLKTTSWISLRCFPFIFTLLLSLIYCLLKNFPF